MSAYFDARDLWKLNRAIKRLGDVPQKCVTKAARKGGNVVMKAVKDAAPVDTGALKRGLKLKAEKSRKKGKKVYEITFPASENDVFQKRNADGEITGYYPVSQEYGYFARNGRYIPGYHYMRESANAKADEMSGVTLKTLSEEIDKEWNKG